ncbi:MAG: Lipid II flippase MurJ [Holosporales bacterium]
MNLLKNVAVISVCTVLSRIVGMVREIFISHILGAGWITDAFVVSLRFPNFFRQFFAEGAFNAAFVPQFSGTLAQNGVEEAKILARNIFSFLTASLIIFCSLVVIFMPQLIYLIAPGFSQTPERLELCILLVRITFPFLLFVSLSSLLSGILNSFDRFAIAAVAPVIANIFLVLSLFISEYTNIEPVILASIALTLSGIVQLILLYITVRKIGFGFLLTIPKMTASTLKILKLMLPGSISTGIMQINLLITMMLSTFLPVGSLSYLFYADRLNQLPLALFGVSMGTALLPELSRLWRKGEREDALKLQETALLLSQQLTIPAAIALICLSTPIISLLFGHGKFTHAEVLQTAPALAAFAIGLPAYVMGRVFTTTFFACENTKTPVKVAIITVILNIVLTLILMRFFMHVGMALATSLSSWGNVLVLGYLLHKKKLFRFTKTMAFHLTKILSLSVAMAFLILSVYQSIHVLEPSLWMNIQEIAIVILTGLLFYGLGAYKMGFLKLLNR